MADKKCNIVFSGKLAQGSKPSEVLSRICTVLGLEGAEVRELFKPGAGAIIGKGLDAGTAYALREKLQSAGVICTVQDIAPAVTREPEREPRRGVEQEGRSLGEQVNSRPAPNRTGAPRTLSPDGNLRRRRNKKGPGYFPLLSRLFFWQLSPAQGGGPTRPGWHPQAPHSPPIPALPKYWRGSSTRRPWMPLRERPGAKWNYGSR